MLVPQSFSRRIAALAFASWTTLAHAADEAAPSLSAELVSLMLPLLLVVGTLLGAFFLLRRKLGMTTSSGPLRIAQVVAVGPRERIVLLELEDRRLVVGVTAHTITRLGAYGQPSAAKTSSETNVFDPK